MDMTGRKITKIAREVGKFTVRNMRREGVGQRSLTSSIWCATTPALPRPRWCRP